MRAVKVQSHIEKDGELHLEGLPCVAGNRVEVIILVTDETTQAERDEALKRFNERADQMQFRSTGPYPTRDELHERH